MMAVTRDSGRMLWVKCCLEIFLQELANVTRRTSSLSHCNINIAICLERANQLSTLLGMLLGMSESAGLVVMVLVARWKVRVESGQRQEPAESSLNGVCRRDA